jgi:hypothetical protein
VNPRFYSEACKSKQVLRMRGRSVAGSVLVLMTCSVATASGVQPVALSVDGIVEATLSDVAARLADGTPYGCFSINTRAGDKILVTLRSKAFDGGLMVARGALCSASALQYDNDNFEPDTRDARVDFTAGGGRYLILARGVRTEARGAYTLEVSGAGGTTARPAPAESDAVHFDGAPSNDIDPAADTVADPTDKPIDRRALMEQQVAVRRAEVAAELAAAEAHRRAVEAKRRLEEEQRLEQERQERQARAERDAQRAQMFGAILNGLNQVATEYSAEQDRIAERNARYAEIAAATERQREAEAEAERARMLAQQAEAARDMEAQRALRAREAQQRAAAAEAARQRAAAASAPPAVIAPRPVQSLPTMASTRSPGSSSGSSRTDSSSRLQPTPEAIIACTRPDLSTGRFRCATPVDPGINGGPKSDLPEHRSPDLMVDSLSASCPGAHRLESATHLVWGCGFGATNNGAQMDRSAGVDVKGRTTYYCYPLETSCRKTSPE